MIQLVLTSFSVALIVVLYHIMLLFLLSEECRGLKTESMVSDHSITLISDQFSRGGAQLHCLGICSLDPHPSLWLFYFYFSLYFLFALLCFALICFEYRNSNSFSLLAAAIASLIRFSNNSLVLSNYLKQVPFAVEINYPQHCLTDPNKLLMIQVTKYLTTSFLPH